MWTIVRRAGWRRRAVIRLSGSAQQTRPCGSPTGTSTWPRRLLPGRAEFADDLDRSGAGAEDRGVLLAGDMLSDLLFPRLDPRRWDIAELLIPAVRATMPATGPPLG